MSMTTVTSTDPVPPDLVEWAVAGMFLDALTRRDFAALRACLDPDLRFRALLPYGPFELCGADEAIGRFGQWFGGKRDVVEVLDAAIGQVGTRIYLRWRLLRRTAGASTSEVVEQHAFVTAGDRIESLDVLCSGFQPSKGTTP